MDILNSYTIYLLIVIFIASVVHAVAGFGFAIIAMPIISKLYGIQFAAPYIAIALVLINLIMLINYRTNFKFKIILPLLVSAFIGIPIGMWVLKNIDERITFVVLGVIMIVYALYSLLMPRLSEIKNPLLGYVFGFISGCLAGAYNTPGPTMVVYGKLAGWPRFEFISNLQGFFLSTSLFVLLTHYLSGNITSDVFGQLHVIILAVLVGLAVGLLITRFIPNELFKRIVLILILLIGIRMLFR